MNYDKEYDLAVDSAPRAHPTDRAPRHHRFSARAIEPRISEVGRLLRRVARRRFMPSCVRARSGPLRGVCRNVCSALRARFRTVVAFVRGTRTRTARARLYRSGVQRPRRLLFVVHGVLARSDALRNVLALFETGKMVNCSFCCDNRGMVRAKPFKFFDAIPVLRGVDYHRAHYLPRTRA